MAKFSKQHYQAIASALNETLTKARNNPTALIATTGEHAVLHVTATLIETFKKDNSRFNREHFLAVVQGERAVNSRPPRS